MEELIPSVEPAAVGLDPARLDRIALHFDGYVERGQLAGWVTTVARRGQLAYVGVGGRRDAEAGTPMTSDTIFRIYSMTKPITTVAMMMLVEEGLVRLTDEIAPIIGAFGEARILVGGTPNAPETQAASEPIRLWHLLTHTAGLSYGFQYASNVDAMYRLAGYELGWPEGRDLAGACDDIAALPLGFEPGSAWCYSMATDVLGRVIECLCGEELDAALRRMVLDPLGMEETAFFVPEGSAERLAQLYIPDGSADGRIIAVDEAGRHALERPSLLSGGGGLVSTAADYRRLTSMLLGGGELDGVRLLGPRTLRYMTRNHLPGGSDLESIAQGLFTETSYEGVGFGLGFSVMLDATKAKFPTTEGSYGWGGAASTAFWVDPVEQLEVAFFTQLLPSSTYMIREELSQLVYAAIVD
jgi:CubicO group peptidase (beta-lactamase class C family)